MDGSTYFYTSLRNDRTKLVTLLVSASEWQLSKALPVLRDAVKEDLNLVQILQQIAAESPSREQLPGARDATSRRAANAAALLAANGYADTVWHLLRAGPFPGRRGVSESTFPRV